MAAPAPVELQALLRRLGEAAAQQHGVELVDLSLKGSGGRRMLRVFIDREGPRGVDVDDCKRVSQALSEVLDETDPIPGGYVLEVSSPGLDRPIRTPDDFRRNTGRQVLLHVDAGDGSQAELHGRLAGQDGGCVLLDEGSGSVRRIPLADVRLARQEVTF